VSAGPSDRSWSDALARISRELDELRAQFGADWAVVWGPLPIRSNAQLATVLFESREAVRSSALGITVPIVGNPWAEAIFDAGGAFASNAPADPRLQLHQWVIRHNQIMSVASGAAIREGAAHAIVELYGQRPFHDVVDPIRVVQETAWRVADALTSRAPVSPSTPAAAPIRDSLTSAALHDLKSALAAQSLLISSFDKELRAVAAGQHPERGRIAAMLESLDVLRESVAHANDLTRVMTLGTLAPGARALVDLPTVAKLALAAISTELRERFVVETDPGITIARPVREAPTLLRVIVALVQNAALAIQRTRGARGFVRIAAHEDAATVVVEDEGPGIDPSVAARLFEPGATTRVPPDGHGYGLYTARQAVERLGGSLTLYSIPRHGARFTLRVPRDVGGL
jgi:signal transduction histidine kinase